MTVNVRTAGSIGIGVGVLGAAAGVWLALVPPTVGADRFSYPLDATAFTAVQLGFAVHHLGLVITVLGLRASNAAPTRAGRRALVAASVGLLGLTVLEVLACLAASSPNGTPTVDRLNTGYGFVTLAIGAAFTVVGVSTLRARRWSGWQRWAPLLVGVYLFVPLTPLMAIGGDVARYGIAGWMLTFVLLGVALRDASSPNATSRSVVDDSAGPARSTTTALPHR